MLWRKPRSFVLFSGSGIVAMFVAFPLMALGSSTQLPILQSLGDFLLFICIALMIAMWFVFVSGKLTGRYRNLSEQPWSSQVW
jgi:hypothetical protein